MLAQGRSFTHEMIPWVSAGPEGTVHMEMGPWVPSLNPFEARGTATGFPEVLEHSVAYTGFPPATAHPGDPEDHITQLS